ncbi:Helix-turn-helix domain protein [Novipirellula aureliae]|uniref:Helix-turn-helix domain protein n=1 Tax=Novipirellula aureliae TaxID=2527966 RepID=A0A5C6DXS0_9BACT|nr:helix-turn-helix domain-containing protein [Novipirellula aureliae]TWU39846.1 Helix-turn-helix domain protein [Novipirellula aureliae]
MAKMFISEQQLVDNFIEMADPGLWTRAGGDTHIKTLFESKCSDGQADWVWSSSPKPWSTELCEHSTALMQNPTCARILAMLKPSAPRRASFLRDRVGVSASTFRRSLGRLTEAKLVALVEQRGYVLGERAKMPEAEVVAFEFKLEDWKRAFYQATRYRSFAHRVYVVMPANIVHRCESQLGAFRVQNIGLLAHDLVKGASRVVPSVKKSPRSKANYLKALAMLHASKVVS